MYKGDVEKGKCALDDGEKTCNKTAVNDTIHCSTEMSAGRCLLVDVEDRD